MCMSFRQRQCVETNKLKLSEDNTHTLAHSLAIVFVFGTGLDWKLILFCVYSDTCPLLTSHYV